MDRFVNRVLGVESLFVRRKHRIKLTFTNVGLEAIDFLESSIAVDG